MTGKPLQICLGVIFSVGLAAAVRAQETPLIEERLLGPDPNNAVIEGRVTLPSGRSADIDRKSVV